MTTSLYLLLGSSRFHNSNSNENIKKAIGLVYKTKSSHVQHTFWYISLASLHDYNLKLPNFRLSRMKQMTTNFYKNLLFLDFFLRNSTSGEFAYMYILTK